MKMRLSLQKKILFMTVLPILGLGIVVMLLCFTLVKNSLIDEVKDSLQSAATATLAAYDQNAGNYIEATNGDIWKGSYNISKSESIVDSIKEKSDVEVTFFYGNRRIMTSAKDADGQRITGSPAGEKITQLVLQEGQEYFSRNVSIDGTLYYGYYVPVIQQGEDAPVGMVFVGTQKAEKDAAINQIIGSMIAAVVAAMLLCIVIVVLYTTSLSKSLKGSIGVVQSVAAGNLKTPVDARFLKHTDEIGDLTRAISQLQEEMKKSLTVIDNNSAAVNQAAEGLKSTAAATNLSMKQVEDGVNSIAASASNQAEISNTASQNIAVMGEKIEQASSEMGDMKENALAMQDAEKQTVATMKQLLENNDMVQTLIQEIAEQTRQTNESAQQIKQASDMIASIAEETSLLSLNASIEAARAGESGRGFAVVAEQIQKLATQSDESSREIEEIVNRLITDSDRAVDTMSRVTQTVSTQTGYMKQTGQMADHVMDKIQQSVNSMEAIENSIAYLEHSRNEIVEITKELSEIAKQNASTTEEVCATVNAVTGGFAVVEDSTGDLKDIAGSLEQSLKHFDI